MAARTRRAQRAYSPALQQAVRAHLESERRRIEAERRFLVSEIERRVENLKCHETIEEIPEDMQIEGGEERGGREEWGAKTGHQRAAEALLHLGGDYPAPPPSGGCREAVRHGWKLRSRSRVGTASVAVYRCDFCSAEKTVQTVW